MEIEHLLMRFGMTHQEARLYAALHRTAGVTGYELAKLTGISRSNAYSGLSSLVEKGGALLIEGKPACYQAVPVREFCKNVIRDLEKTRMLLEEALPHPPEQEEGYATVKGERNIGSKIETMILAAKTHIYLSMSEKDLAPFLPLLQEIAEQGKKVVVITNRPLETKAITVWVNPSLPDSIRIISDTEQALTGCLSSGPDCSCLYSNKKNLVDLLRDSMKNEILLIQMTGGQKR